MSQFDQVPGENKREEYVDLESLNLTEAELKSIQAFEELGSGSGVAVLQEGGKKVKASLGERLREFRKKWGVSDDECIVVIHGKMWQNPTPPRQCEENEDRRRIWPKEYNNDIMKDKYLMAEKVK